MTLVFVFFKVLQNRADPRRIPSRCNSRLLAKLVDWVLGNPLRSDSSESHKVGVLAGVPVLGLDALSSAAYGPEAALTILLPLGAAGLGYASPLVGIIVALLFVLFLSYRQTIEAYPSGGGSYTVASSNLGTLAGLFAAAALMLDYILTVAVGISAGIGALVSALPQLHPYILVLCLVTLGVITVVNLRGVKDAGAIFFVPTYLFVVSLLTVLIYGTFQAVAAGGHPHPMAAPVHLPKAIGAATPWLLMRAFASGCTAMTGVEAVSNGIQAFKEPRVKTAQKALGFIVLLLALMLVGIVIVSNAYHVGAVAPDSKEYQSVISQLVAAIVGRGAIYYVTLFSVIAVLALSANTGFADFPRLCHLLAEDDFLPHLFAVRGRRLVYSTGIVILAIGCAVLLIAFGGITDRLIPLFAVGAFLAFTLSQAGMVRHWMKSSDRKRHLSMVVNGLGAVCTAVALAVVLAAKFVEGAWITVLLIPVLVVLFRSIKRHYQWVRRKVSYHKTLDLADNEPPVVVLPIKGWDSVAASAFRFAMSISENIVAIYVEDEEGDFKEIEDDWARYVVKPLEGSKKPMPQLRTLRSPFRRFIRPVLEEVKKLKEDHPNRVIAIVIPELVERSLITIPLHNQRSQVLKAALLFGGGKNVVVLSVPWYLKG